MFLSQLAVFRSSMLMALVLLYLPSAGFAQYTHWLNVNCASAVDNPPSYASLNAALAAATDRTGIYVMPGSVCNERVAVVNFASVGLVTDQSSTFKIVGNLGIQDSISVYIYGAAVSDPSGDGINVNSSRAVTLDDCGVRTTPA